MSDPGVSFETKVWEGDYRTVLDPRRLTAQIERNGWEFVERAVIINNVRQPRAVAQRCRRLVRSGVIDNFHVAAELAPEVLDRVGLTAGDLGIGYKYSIAELVGAFVCRTQHLLHFAGDSMLHEKVHWMPKALELLTRRDDVKVVNLIWDGQVEGARAESTAETQDFFFSQGFSDQMYLVRAADFTAPIYAERHTASDRYPGYGGELFEKRVDSWLRNNDYLRAVSKAGSYYHRNIRPHRPMHRRAAGLVRARLPLGR